MVKRGRVWRDGGKERGESECVCMCVCGIVDDDYYSIYMLVSK